MAPALLIYLFLVIIIVFLVMLANKLNTAYPIVLVIGGLLISLIPGIPTLKLNPEYIFLIFLPPLLYEAAWFTSWKNFWRWRRVITSFAFLIVIFTSLVVAVVSSHIIPGFTMALGFLLGGIISPPDAVSATTILKTVKVPKRVTAILEGESLLNDASSLIIFRFALIAVDTGKFIFQDALFDFVVVIVMGVVAGIAIALVFYAIHKFFPTNADIDTILTLATPYVMYIMAEHFHVSGVLAVVSGGLFLSSRSQIFLSHRSRLRSVNVWSSFSFVLNGIVFMLIGLELPEIVSQLGDVSLITAIGYGLLITLLLVVIRLLSTLGSSVFTVFISRYIRTADARPGWKGPVIIGWAGMRGVVSLAAALSIPLTLSDGSLFPERNLILFITFMVILLTLVVQGLTLPWLIKWVGMEDPDNMLPSHDQDIQIRKTLAENSLHYLKENFDQEINEIKALKQIVENLSIDHKAPDPIKNSDKETFRKVYLQLLGQQRKWLHDINKVYETNEDVVRRHHGLIDLEEERLSLKSGDIEDEH